MTALQEAPTEGGTASASPPRPQLVRWPTEEEPSRLAFTSAVSSTFKPPDELAPLAAAGGRTPLHYEMLELMWHATPSVATLDDVGHVLDAVRSRLGLPLCFVAAGNAWATAPLVGEITRVSCPLGCVCARQSQVCLNTYGAALHATVLPLQHFGSGKYKLP